MTSKACIRSGRAVFWIILAIVLMLSLVGRASAQGKNASSEGKVQFLTGKIEPGRILFYALPHLKAG